jgi:hypothetical protein
MEFRQNRIVRDRPYNIGLPRQSGAEKEIVATENSAIDLARMQQRCGCSTSRQV